MRCADDILGPYNPFSTDPEDSGTTGQPMGISLGRAPSNSEVPEVAEAMAATELEDGHPERRVATAWGLPDEEVGN